MNIYKYVLFHSQTHFIIISLQFLQQQMANSKYEYVKLYEQSDTLLPNTWLVVRIDGRSFHRLNQFSFSNRYNFAKPNDRRALDLMNSAAKAVMNEISDIILGYGVSDEYSKLVSTVVSTFTAYYVHFWSNFFIDTPLSPPLPSFDGRIIQYPSIENLRDYMSWRQVDCEHSESSHINNLYNTTFWSLIQLGGLDAATAEKELSGTLSADKNEILFSRFKINYNNEPEIYKKGSVIYHNYELIDATTTCRVTDENSDQIGGLQISKAEEERNRKRKVKAGIILQHLDIIKDEFWVKRPWLISNKPGKIIKVQ
ncbi:tRNA guanylyltransferase [Golovinomyces cichoracearum]|uniref:tRNA(His) guanylyltransferase n=1 Tax=Golovinomyces cichoracearum TaxID=62708 RepID=A0A420J0N0_9PEZI|nr:tRNA guanylyltransferase [Golovinomyces cichoracearum]